MKKKRSPFGFTLIEILLSIALITLMTSISLPFYQSIKIKNDLSLASHTLSQSLREAQIRAQASEGDSPWGVHIDSQQITLFKGHAYSTHNPEEAIFFQLPPGLVHSGPEEVIFSKMQGYPNVSGEITLAQSEQYFTQIQINEKGFISY